MTSGQLPTKWRNPITWFIIYGIKTAFELRYIRGGGMSLWTGLGIMWSVANFHMEE